MGVICIHQEENGLSITGDVGLLFQNRRSSRFLKDNTDATLINEKIFISIKDTLEKTIERINVSAKYASCDVELSDSTRDSMSNFLQEEEKFQDFSENARKIRNNDFELEDFKKFKDVLTEHLPSRTLYPIQMLSAYHLAFSQNACNFSVPGAGKTSIVYGAYCYLKNLPEENPRKVDRLLIISPLNAFGPWELEYQECFGKAPESQRLGGTMTLEEKRQALYSFMPAEITLTSYSSLVSLKDELEMFLRKYRVMMVLDEAHKIKNTKGGIQAETVLQLSEYCKSRVVLTGTPAPNGYEDLLNLFKFIWPKKDLIKFQAGQLKDMSQTRGDVRVDSLLHSIAPFFIRIKKSDLGIEVPTNHPPIFVDMGEKQRKIYNFIETKYIQDIAEGKDLSFKNELVKARLIRLMQAATNPALLKEPLSQFREIENVSFDLLQEDTRMLREINEYVENEVPAKYIKVKNMLVDMISKGEKAIVWACYIKNINFLHDYLKSEGISSRMLYGATPVATDDMSEEELSLTREAIVKEFHRPECSYQVLIANPFAVAESISLHKVCHNAIYLERTFNAAHFLQSKDRIHRYGLEEGIKTNYYYILSHNSVDLTVHERLEIKETRLVELMESMPIPLFENISQDGGDEDIKAVLRDYAQRIKKK